MKAPLIAIVGDANPGRQFNPPMIDPGLAKQAAEQLGAELARRGARLLVYGGPFVESDVVRGFVAAKPRTDHSILKWYTKGQEPPPFPEEATAGKLFQTRVEQGVDWETAFYRSITRAHGIILLGGATSTKIVGQVAIGSRIPILCLRDFGGGAAEVWSTLSAGEDLPTRDELSTMAATWSSDSAAECVNALFAQISRKRFSEGTPRPLASLLAGILFLMAMAIVPFVWGRNSLHVWMLFAAPILAGAAGAIIRSMVEWAQGTRTVDSVFLAPLVLGLVAGGISGVLFVTAQLTGAPDLAAGDVAEYARRSIPYAVAIGFVAGLTSDAVFGKLLGLQVIHTSGITGAPTPK
jgi:hypothetical protein